MCLVMKEIVPITDLQRQAGQIINSLSEKEEPVIVTQRGRASAVIISAKRYSEIEEDLKRLDELEALEMVEKSRQDISLSKTLSHDKVKKLLNFPSEK